MQIILSDHNCEEHAQQIILALSRIGLAEITPVQLVFFSDVGLPFDANDETIPDSS
jgi:hypothetical protein